MTLGLRPNGNRGTMEYWPLALLSAWWAYSAERGQSLPLGKRDGFTGKKHDSPYMHTHYSIIPPGHA